MSRVTFDCEVSMYDWLVVFKDHGTKKYTVFHNDSDALRDFINPDDYYVGFNSKHYDRFIIQAICEDFEPQEIKKLSDWLISGGNGWQYPPLQGQPFRFNDVDIRDDTQIGLSLKAIEGHFGMSVEETTVDFNLNRPWTEDELREMVLYCKHDVDTTEYLTDVRREYLRTKMNIGAMVNINPIRAMSMTNAKLTAAFLRAKPPDKPWTDEREYKIPDNLKREYIPQEVFDFFARMYDKTLSDDDIFKSQLEISIGECPVTLAYGGIHGALPTWTWRQDEHPDRIIRNYDVASYYPHLMVINGYTSRNIPNAKIYSEMLERRMEAKKAGDKSLANALKLVANTTYGATLNRYNDLYDPLMARSVCVSGQLYLLEIARHLYSEIPDLKIVQLNTDGIMIEFGKEQYDAVIAITTEWQQRTGFELEEDKIQAIVQKDVNNYVEIAEDGGTKTKGGYLVRGVAPAGAFNINNNATIVAKAIAEYFIHGTAPEETVRGCDDISCFQLIAKAGAKYREAYHMVDGERQPVQKVNRVYATTDTRYGKLYKVKAADDSEAKIERLPEHCIIDNTAIDNPNHTPITLIDRAWYIDQAKDGIDKFLGIVPEKPKKERKTKMATRKETAPAQETPAQTPAPAPAPTNVYYKLLTARKLFLSEAIKKGGKAMKLGYKYFELDDIVPVALPIFYDLHLLPQVSFTNDEATMVMIDCDNPDGPTITFSSPMREDTGGLIKNEVQKLGSVQTYLRRYLYMMALDIVEADQIEANSGLTKPNDPTPAPAPAPAPKPPVAPEKREEIKKELTDTDGKADELQLTALRNAVKKLRGLGGNDEACIKIAMETKAFTDVSKARCEELIKAIRKTLRESEENANE